jgi:vacuolar-type H+-ATPase subunit E/Vma4
VVFLLDNLIKSEIDYKESQFKNDMEKIRNTVKTELQKGVELVNKGEVNEEDYYKQKGELINAARAARSKLLQERQKAIDEVVEGFERKLSGCQGETPEVIDKFKSEYMKYAEADKDSLIKAYKLSLKVGDEIGLRAAGLAAFEKDIREITSDYKQRNPEFFEAAEQQSEFLQRFYGTEERFMDMLGHYRGIDTYPEEKQPYKAGYVVLDAIKGQQPYYRNKLKLKY